MTMTPRIDDQPDDGDDSVAQTQSALGLVRVLDTVAKVHVRALAQASDLVMAQPGDTILARGQDDDLSLYGVAEGKVRAVRPSFGPGAFDIEEFGAGDTIGLAAVLGADDGVPVSIVALTAALLVRIDSMELKALIASDHGFARTLLRNVAREWARSTAPDDTELPPVRRVHRHLLSLAEPSDTGLRVPSLPRHAALAEAAGVSPRDAAVALALLIDEGVARRDYPGLVIESPEELRRLAR